MKYENSGWLFEIQWKGHLISLPLLSECLSKKNVSVFPVKVLYMHGGNLFEATTLNDYY